MGGSNTFNNIQTLNAPIPPSLPTAAQGEEAEEQELAEDEEMVEEGEDVEGGGEELC
jgi:hypothetical protein